MTYWSSSLTTTLYDLVKVIWEDSSTDTGGWQWIHELDEELEPMLVVSVGYLINENEDQIVLAPSLSDDFQVNQLLYIPKSCILEYIKMEEGSYNNAS